MFGVKESKYLLDLLHVDGGEHVPEGLDVDALAARLVNLANPTARCVKCGDARSQHVNPYTGETLRAYRQGLSITGACKSTHTSGGPAGMVQWCGCPGFESCSCGCGEGGYPCEVGTAGAGCGS